MVLGLYQISIIIHFWWKNISSSYGDPSYEVKVQSVGQVWQWLRENLRPRIKWQGNDERPTGDVEAAYELAIEGSHGHARLEDKRQDLQLPEPRGQAGSVQPEHLLREEWTTEGHIAQRQSGFSTLILSFLFISVCCSRRPLIRWQSQPGPGACINQRAQSESEE